MKKLLAFFLLIIGVGMVCCGVFYDKIIELTGGIIEEKTPSTLTCIRTETSKENGFSTSETSKMYFDKKGLTKIEDRVVISPVDNSEESINKLSLYYKDMEEYITEKAASTEGLKSKFEFATNRIKYNMNFDMKNIKTNSGKKEESLIADIEEEVTKEVEDKKEFEFTSVDKDYKVKYNYHDSYKDVRADREKNNYTCS